VSKYCMICCAFESNTFANYIVGEEIWTKLTYLRDERKRNVKKIKASKRSGAGSDDVYKPTIWWFDLVAFLDTDIECRSTQDNLDQSDMVRYFKLTVNVY